MSKRKKKKLKRKNKTAQKQIVSKQKNTSQKQSSSFEKNPTLKTDYGEQNNPKEEDNDSNIYTDADHAYIKKDTIKVIAILGGLIVMMIVIYLLNGMYSFLKPFGDWLYQITNIQAQ